LLQTPSVNCEHNELAIAQLIAAEAKRLGLHVQIVGASPARPNVIVSTSPTGNTGLLLIGHMDTVPTGDEKLWTYPPVSGTIAEGRIYGRGAVDTKGGIASALYALAALAQHPEILSLGRAQLICVPDEESGATGELGIKFLASQGLLQGDGAIYAYSGDKILLGHRGVLRYRITTQGESVHTGSTAWQDGKKGANAVTALAAVIHQLDSIHLPFSEQPYFDKFRTVITPGTIIEGATAVSMVSASYTALIDIRTTPEFAERTKLETLLDQAFENARSHYPRVQFEYELLTEIPPVMSNVHAPLFTAAEAAIRAVKGIEPERAVAGPANEGYLLIERGIPTICGLGPTGANYHAVDAAAIFALTACQF
jgi:succinyl-diaminopimelate desuccinylase